MRRPTFRQIWVFTAGFAVILLGIIMAIPLIPGPGFLVIPAGIAILATEFPWARRLLIRLKDWGRRILPRYIAKRIHFSEDEKKVMSGGRKKSHAPAAD